MRKVVITGGAGFIGANLARHGLEMGDRVIVYDSLGRKGGIENLAWLRGVDAYTMGAYPQAEEEFRTAVRLDPGMADGWLGRE